MTGSACYHLIVQVTNSDAENLKSLVGDVTGLELLEEQMWIF